MSFPIRPHLMTFASLLALFAGAFPAGASPEPASIANLAWLEGAWGGTQDGVASEEHWTSPAGGGLVGMHKDVQAGKMSGFEFLRIEIDARQRICYVAMPGGKAPTSFCAVEIGERRVVFENTEHDFPQRILYWLAADGSLHARIEGPLDGKQAAMEWTWSRLPG